MNTIITLDEIYVQNFWTFGNDGQTIRLNEVPLTLILGKNMDVPGEGSRNGAGKTAILHAISYALWGKVVGRNDKRITKNKLVNFINRKNTIVGLLFRVGGIKYEITRGIKPDSLELLREGEDITQSISDTSTVIEDLTGMSYDIFRHTIQFSATSTHFLSLSAAKQTEVMEFLFGIGLVSLKAEAARQYRLSIKSEIAVEQDKLTIYEETNRNAKRAILNAKNQHSEWVATHQTKLEKLKHILDKINTIDFETEEMLHAQYANGAAQLIEHNKCIDHLSTQIKRTNSALNKSTNELRHLHDNTCPYCEQIYQDSPKKIQKVQTELDALRVTHTEQSDQLALVNENINTLTASIDKLDDMQISDTNTFQKLKNNKEQYAEQLKQLNEETNPFIETITELRNQLFTAIDTTALDSLQDEHTHVDFLYKLLNDKTSFLRKEIITTTLPYLNQQIKLYASQMGLMYELTFKNDLTISVMYLEEELGYDNISNGETLRANLSINLAFHDVLMAMHAHVNVLFLDEVLDAAVDELGMTKILKIIKDLALQYNLNVFLISHREEAKSSADSVLLVTKEEGCSEISAMSE